PHLCAALRRHRRQGAAKRVHGGSGPHPNRRTRVPGLCGLRKRQRLVADEDGLIGADVFGAYLIDIDLPGMRLKLSPLPKRPEDTVAPTSLNSEGEEQANAEQKSADQKEDSVNEPTSKDQKPPPPISKPARRLPKDRYIAPEMADWTKVFRFGHSILVPTSVNDSKSMLFGLDTGAFSNLLSMRAGRQVSKVSSDDRVRVHGLNGAVDKVYSSEKATLRFGHSSRT